MATPRRFLSGPVSSPPPADHVRPEGWRESAACLNHKTLRPQAWDDSLGDEEGRGGSPLRAKRIAAAIAVCKTCPVKDPCLAEANLQYDDGVRGGVDLRELKKPKAPRRSDEDKRLDKLTHDRLRYSEKVPCPNGCGKTIARGNVPRHLRRACDALAVAS